MKRTLIAALAFILAGCAAAPPIKPVAGANIDALKTEKIAVSYHLVGKQINYSEVLYRVLWLENTSSTQDFSGVWTADQDMTEYVAARIKSQGFHAESVFHLANADTVNAENRSMALKVRQNATKLQATKAAAKVIPPTIFFEETPDAPEFAALADALRDKGYRYLAEFTAMDLVASAPGYGLVIVAAAPNLRIVDLQSNKVVWTQNLYHYSNNQLGGDLKKLEENGMGKTKAALKEGIDKFDFIGLWGVSPVTVN